MQSTLIKGFGVLFADSENCWFLRINYSLIPSIPLHSFGNSVAADICGFPYCHDLADQLHLSGPVFLKTCTNVQKCRFGYRLTWVVSGVLSCLRGAVRQNRLETCRAVYWHFLMTKRSPFRCSKSSPKIIHLVVMMYDRFPVSLSDVKDRLQELGIDISYETVRFWWIRFSLLFASDICKKPLRTNAILSELAVASRQGFNEDRRRDALPLSYHRSRRRGAGILRNEPPPSSNGVSIVQHRFRLLRSD